MLSGAGVFYRQLSTVIAADPAYPDDCCSHGMVSPFYFNYSLPATPQDV
jgi:hypothetical protein